MRPEVRPTGIDVALNSLAGEFVDTSLGLLGEGGRFVEMGKTDIRDRAETEAAHLSVAYCAFDLAEAGEERMEELLAEILAISRLGPVTAICLRQQA